MKNLVSMISGTSYDKNDIIKDGLRVLRGGNIQNFKLLIDDDDVFLPLSYLNENTLIKKNDILIVASTGSKEVIGKTGFVNNVYFNTTIGAFLRIIRPLFTNISQYLNVYFKTEFYRKIIRDSVRGTNINNLKSNIILDMYFPLPPLEEQQRIVDKINSFEPLLEKYDKIERELSKVEKEFPDKLKKSILQYAIKGKLVKQDPNDEPASVLLERIKQEKERLIKEGQIKRDKNESYIYQGDDKNYYENLPINWEYVPLIKCGTLTRGSGIKRNETIVSGYPCIRYGELYTTYKTLFTKAVSSVNYDVYNSSHKIKNNDVVMALTGENKQDISMALAYLGNEEVAMGGDMTCFSNHQLNPLYLVFVLNSPYCMLIKRKLATGDIIVHMSNDRLASIRIPVPPIKEQNRIVSKINKIFKVIE